MMWEEPYDSSQPLTNSKETLIKRILRLEKELEQVESICKQKIDEACKKQRESDAEIFKGYSTLTKQQGFAYEDDFNIYCKILANAPSPKENDND